MKGNKMPNHLPIATFVSKGRNGWTAETRVDLGDNWELYINTRKRDRGGIYSSASVHRIEHGSGYSSRVHRLFRDYSETVTVNGNARCTQKNIEAQHDDAVGALPEVIAAVAAHYAGIGEPIASLQPDAAQTA